MASQGPNSPITIVEEGPGIGWTNLTNVATEDGNFATVNVFGSVKYLKSTKFGFNIPNGSLINGIIVDVKRKKGGIDSIKDAYVYIVKSDDSYGSLNKASMNLWTTTNTYESHGDSSDLWEESWQFSDINNDNFGVAIRPMISGTPLKGATAYIDHIRITVYYTEGDTTPPTKTYFESSGKIVLEPGTGRIEFLNP
jgi:hypothetical protein